MGAQTLRLHADAAGKAMSLLTGKPCVVYDPATLSQKHVTLHPYLAQQIQQRKIWSKPKDRHEPLTYDIIQELSKYPQHAKIHVAFLSLEALVYDTCRLGCFTGSRISEYGQTNLRKGVRFQTVPMSVDAGAAQWAGLPLAFIRSDFTFYDVQHCLLDSTTIFAQYRAGSVAHLAILFRYDKSPRNFSIRKFTTTDDLHLDAVNAAVSLIHRADLLGIPLDEPICAFQASGRNATSTFLRDYHVKNVIQAAAIRAYPNPRHYLRVNIHCLVPHSNRVTAALVLKLGGDSLSDIAWKLRWTEGSVPGYLRECWQELGTKAVTVLQGAWKTSSDGLPKI